MSDEHIKPILQTKDWNAEWQLLQKLRQKSDSPEEWDKRASTFPVKHGSQEGYVARFLELADIQPGETVFDMGCGTGALATPLALAGHHVIACDFSRGMLDAMEADQRKLGATGVEVKQFSWTDDWAEHGIMPKSADVAVASRSIATNDLQSALLKLNSVARRKACITLPSGPSPRSDDELLAACGFPNTIGRDFLYAFVILTTAGFKPEVSYITNTRVDRFDSRTEAFESLLTIVTESVRGIASEDEIAAIPGKLDAWLDENLVSDGSGVRLKHERNVVWAYLSWQTT